MAQHGPQTDPHKVTEAPSATRTPPWEGGRHSISRIIALMNQKGGVGKTTTAVNLAAAIAEQGRTTLLVDLDPQAHASMHLGVDPAEQRATLYDLLMNPYEPGNAPQRGVDPLDALICARPNLGLIPASTDLAAAESELASAPDRQLRLTKILEPLRPLYEFILIDCPPSLGLLTLNALAVAREVIVPMQPQFLALQGLGKLLETVTLVGRSVNPKLRVSGVTLCMHEETTRHAREVVADIEAFFAAAAQADCPWRGAKVYRPPVRRNIKLAECPSFGQTIFEYAPGCQGALDYAGLGETLIAEWDQMLARRLPGPKPEPPVHSTSPKSDPSGRPLGSGDEPKVVIRTKEATPAPSETGS